MKAEGGRSPGRAPEGCLLGSLPQGLGPSQAYKADLFRAHLPVFHKEVTHDVANIFREMAEMTGLMGTKIHPVQDQWQGKKELHMANHMAKGSVKNLHYFQVVSLVKSP